MKPNSREWIKKLEAKYPTLKVQDPEFYDNVSIRNTFLRVTCKCSKHPSVPFQRTYENIFKNGCPVCRAIERVKEITEQRKDNIDGFKLSLNMDTILKEFDKTKSYTLNIDCECSACKQVFTRHSTKIVELGTKAGRYRLVCPHCKFTSSKPIIKIVEVDRGNRTMSMEVITSIKDIEVEMEHCRSELTKMINELPYDLYQRVSMALCRPHAMLKSLIKEI